MPQDSFTPDKPAEAKDSFVPDSFVPDKLETQPSLGLRDLVRSGYNKLMSPLAPEADTSGTESLLGRGIEVGANVPGLNKIWPGGIHIPGAAEIYNELIRPITSPFGLATAGVEGAIAGKGMLSRPSDIPLAAEEQNIRVNPQTGERFAGDTLNKVEQPGLSKIAPELERKALPPAQSIQLGEGTLKQPSLDEPALGTGQPVELLHPNMTAPASEIIGKIPDAPEPLKVAAKSPDPIIQGAVQDVAESGWLDKIKNRNDPLTIAAEELVKRQGVAGEVISQKLDRASLKERMYLADAKSKAPTALSLTPEDFSKAVDVVEGTTAKASPEIMQAASEISSSLQDLGQKLEDAGVSLKNRRGETVPFKMRSNYFPHTYPPEFWDRTDVLQKLVDSGMSREEALNAVQMRRKYGEQLGAFQHQRIPADLEGYLKTQQSYLDYLNKASRRAAMAEELGPEDITGKSLNDLIEQTKDPVRTTKLLRRLIPGRDEPLSLTEQMVQPLNNLSTKLMAYAHLSRYAISRMAPATEMILRSNTTNFIKEVGKVLTNSGYAEDIRNGTGVTENISNAMLDAVNKYPKNWMFAKTADDFMRTVSGGMGRGLATDLFEKLKKNPTDIRTSTRLNNLLLQNTDELLKQKELTPQQLNLAGARFSEMTQGLPEARKVPLAFSEPLLQIPLIMKKYAFQHGKMLKDAIAENPARNIPLAIALTQIFGEAIGDVKAGIKGGTTAAVGGDTDPLEAIANRGGMETSLMSKMGMGQHPTLGRIADNFTNAWIPFEIELMQSLTDKSGLARAVVGPMIGDVSSLLGGGWKELKRQAVSDIPLVGSPDVARELAKP